MSLVFIPIKFGYIEEGKFIGWTAITCQYCKAAQPACCFDITHQNTLYGMKVTNARAYSKRLVCSFCNETFDLPPEAVVNINESWTPEQGFQQLVNTTRPALGYVGGKKTRSVDEVKAILKRIEDWTRYSFHNEGQMGFLFALIGIVALIAGAIIGSNIPPRGDVKSFSIIFGVPFAVVVCLISYFIVKYFSVRRNLLRRLSQAGADKGITRDEFVKALTRLPRKKKELVWAVNKLKHREK